MEDAKIVLQECLVLLTGQEQVNLYLNPLICSFEKMVILPDIIKRSFIRDFCKLRRKKIELF